MLCELVSEELRLKFPEKNNPQDGEASSPEFSGCYEGISRKRARQTAGEDGGPNRRRKRRTANETANENAVDLASNSSDQAHVTDNLERGTAPLSPIAGKFF